MPNPTPRQIPLDLARPPDYSFARFERGPSNDAALLVVQAYPSWPAPILLLTGPSGSGKTHLARAWAADNKAVILENAALSPAKAWIGQPLLLDDAEGVNEGLLFAVMNMALNGDIPGLLLTSQKLTAAWGFELPDLKSRLKNVATAHLQDPDDTILEAIARNLFAEQGRDVSRDLVQYLLTYQDRSAGALKAVIQELDHAASAAKADLTKTFAARYLAQRAEPDLF